MSVTIKVPGILKTWLDGRDEIRIRGRTIDECMDHLEKNFPGIKIRLKSSIIFLNKDDIRTLRGMATTVRDGDEITIFPMLAGG